MNQYHARICQLYVLTLFGLAMYVFDLKLFLIAFSVGWVLQGISLETLLHRKYAHNQFRYKNIFWEFVCYLILLSTSLGRPYEWCFGHRVHHRYTDQTNDPQSPHSNGWVRTFLSIFPRGVKGWDGIDTDLRNEPRLMFFNRYYYHFYIAYNIIWFAIDPTLALYFIGIPSVFAWFTLGVIDTAAHLKKGSPNNVPFPLWFWGGNYHATHHKHPHITRLGPRDLSYYVMKVIGIENAK